MAEVVLDGLEIRSVEEVHDRFAQALDLPDYYGRNLDALYDCLTERTADTRLELHHVPALEAALGDYAGALLDTLRDAARDNPRLQVEFFS